MTLRLFPTTLWIAFGFAILLATVWTLPAQAAIWAWGCQGQMGDRQIIFNRDRLSIVKSKARLGSLDAFKEEKIDGLIKGEHVDYRAVDPNSGFQDTIAFEQADEKKQKLVLAEKSSRSLSKKHRVVCGRDEDTVTFRKTYSVTVGDAPPQPITMQCIEYQLSTRGGRPGCE